MKKPLLTTFTLTSAVALSALSLVTQATENPFAANSLKAGYQLAQADTKSAEGKYGEAKCGAKKAEEGKCGAEAKPEEKAKEGKCGEGKCGAEAKPEEKAKEGKCGEGKCGAKN